MIDIALDAVTLRYGENVVLAEASARFPAGSHTALAGSGKSAILDVISGAMRPNSGRILLGGLDAAAMRSSRRPLLRVGASRSHPRWSVAHSLVAAVRTRRGLDSADRRAELESIADRWSIAPLLDRRIDSLSPTDAARSECARIEALRPAVLLIDRLFRAADPAESARLADFLHRHLRTIGTTVISEIARFEELAFHDRVAALDGGRFVQIATPMEVFETPATAAVALSIGAGSTIPIIIRGCEADSPIGRWKTDAGFEGSGVAIIRPSDLAVAGAGEESDFLLSVEEAGYFDGAWQIRGFVSGGTPILMRLAAPLPLHKGRLIPVRIATAKIRCYPAEHAGIGAIPTDLIPPMSETR